MAKFGTEIWGIHDTQALLFVVYVVALDCGFCADWDGDGGIERWTKSLGTNTRRYLWHPSWFQPVVGTYHLRLLVA